MSLSLASDIVTVNWPSSVGSAAKSSLAEIETVAASSSEIVTVAVLAPDAVSIVTSLSSVPVNVKMTVSLSSSRSLSMVSTSIVAEVSPAAIVTLPERVVKSDPLLALPAIE